MALMGQRSLAHVYDRTTACIYCGMYKNTVDLLSHVCTKERELEVDGHWLNEPKEAIDHQQDVPVGAI